jgi:hypothetical protein
MGFIRVVLSLIIILIIAVFAYWLYAAYALNSSAPYWAEINGRLPDSLRRYACQEMRKRETSGQIQSCEGY